MATKEELFVSISPEEYRASKSNVLMSQADLLGTLKRLHTLKVLARQKQDLKKRLHKLFSIVLSDIDSLQDKMPTPKMPKAVKREGQSEEEPKRDFSKRDGIEEELVAIKEKLKQLNN